MGGGETRRPTTTSLRPPSCLTTSPKHSIAVVTAVVGFAQSMLVASLYKLRTEMLWQIAEARGATISSVAVVGSLWRVAALNLLLATGAALSVALISPAAAGSGIPDVKAFLNGADRPAAVFRDFFTLRTFVAKVLGSALAVASSLCVGKEGPLLHAGSILAVLLGRHAWFGGGGLEGGGAATTTTAAEKKNKGKKPLSPRASSSLSPSSCYGGPSDVRDLVAAGAACGVCTAFRAPVGGVLFAMEISTRWSKELTWRCFLAAAVAVLVVRGLVAACAGRGLCSQLRWGSLAFMNASYPASIPLALAPQLLLLAVLGGWAGSMFVALNTWVCLVRKKWARRKIWRLLEVAVLSAITSAALLSLPLVVRRCAPCRTGDPRHCVELGIGGGAGAAGGASSSSSSFRTFAGGYGCPEGEHNEVVALAFAPQGFLIQALFAAPRGAFHPAALAAFALVFFLLGALTYGAMLPSGLFTVALIFGGCLGRLWAELWQGFGAGAGGAHEQDEGLVGLHALLGAAAFLGGVMRMSASACLVLMEMTQAPQTLPFLMVALVVSKGVGDQFNLGVFDTQILLKGLGVVGGGGEGGGGGGERARLLTAGDVMSGVVEEEEGGGVPALARSTAMLRVSETRARVAAALDRHREARAFAVCAAAAAAGEEEEDEGESGSPFLGMISRHALFDLLRHRQHQQHNHLLDLAPHVEPAPVVVPPSLPLRAVYALMQAQGLEVLPVVREHGPLEGLVTRCVFFSWAVGALPPFSRPADPLLPAPFKQKTPPTHPKKTAPTSSTLRSVCSTHLACAVAWRSKKQTCAEGGCCGRCSWVHR
jgi:chloride channel 7